MNTPLDQAGKPASHHPMMIIAAIAIILFCVAGTAAIMGWIPSSIGSNTSRGDLTASDRAALATTLSDNNGMNNGTNNGANIVPSKALANSLDSSANNSANNSVNRNFNGIEAQRENERLALLDRNDGTARTMAPVAYREPAYREPAYREPANREPVRLAQADTSSSHKVCSNCGRVASVRAIKTRARGTGMGAAGGAVLGGLLGHQIGGGTGNKIATVAGAVGGAVVGNQVEGNMRATTSYEVQVHMDNGGSRTFHLQNLNGYNTGDRIKVVNGALHHAG